MTSGFTTTELLYPITKGDFKGHPFRGNQYISFGVASYGDFKKQFEKAFKGSKYSAFVNHYTMNDMKSGKMTAVISKDGKTGVLVHDHGDGRVEATALFSDSKVKGAGLKILNHAIDKYGVNYVECFGNFLPALYGKLGFQVESVSPWNPDYAPDNWNYKEFGTPSYYTMRLAK
jgi:hypothetical protein